PSSTVSTTSEIISGLINGQEYTLRVTATNEVGDSFSSATATVTPAATSSSPYALKLDVLSSTEIDLEWSPPKDTSGGAVTGYLIERHSGDGVFVEIATTIVDGTSSDTTYSDTGVFPGSTHTYRVSAINAAGTSAPSGSSTATTFTVPGAPSNLTTIRGDTEVFISWGVPLNDGGTVVTSYVVEYHDGTGWQEYADPLISSPGIGDLNTFTIVSDLTNGADYLFQVFAVNSVGQGSPSNVDDATPAGVPDAPTNISTTRGDTLVTLSWDEPANNGDEITKYIIEFYDGATWREFPDTISLTFAVVDNLSNGKEYSFRVSAENTVGHSTTSVEVTATPAGIPDEPIGVFTVPDNRQVTLSWDAPYDGGSVITGYVAEYSTDGSSWTTFTDDTDDDLEINVTGLSNGREYHFRVHAINDVGPGSVSVSVTGTPLTVASSPSTLTATTNSDTVIDLSWDAPATTGGSTIIGYLIVSHSGDDNFVEIADTRDDADPTAITYSDTGLTPDTTYSYKVSTITDAGSSEPSGTSSATTLSTPSVPTNLTTIPDDESMNLSWTAPTNIGGSALTQYTVEYSEIGDFSDAVQIIINDDPLLNSVALSSLTNGQDYTFRVLAINLVGSSPWSETITDSPFTTPDTIADLTAARGPSDATLSWTEPNDNGRTISEYLIEFSTTGTFDADTPSFTTTGSPPENFAVVPDLTPGQTTTFRVTSTNLAGDSDPSNVASATPAIAPEPPTGLIAVLDTETSDSAFVSLTWYPPTFNGGAAITQYIVEMSQDDFLTKQNLLASGTSFTIDELLNGITYQFRVVSLNTVGTSAPSDPVSVGVSDKPTFTARITGNAGNGYAILEWDSLPIGNGAPIIGWQVVDRYETGNEIIYLELGQDEFDLIGEGSDLSGFDSELEGYDPTLDEFNPEDFTGDDPILTGDTTDTDGDGWFDFEDECPSTPGDFFGCVDDPFLDGGSVDFVGVDPALAHGMIIPNLINGEKYVFEVSPVNENGASRSTNTVVVVPNSEAGETGVATDVDFVENPTVDSTQTAAQSDKNRQGDSIPPSSSLTSDGDFDQFDESYNQSIIYDSIVSDTDINDPAVLATEYGLPEYSPPAELKDGQVWSVPPAIIELEETGFDTIVDISAPGIPRNLIATSGEANQVSLSWTYPSSDSGVSVDDGNSDVSGYLVEYLLSGTWFGVEQTIDTNITTQVLSQDSDRIDETTTLIFPDSINGLEYSFRVSAINAGGIGSATSAVTATSYDVPLAPTDVTVRSGNTEIALLWTSPATGGSTITDYVIEYSTDGTSFSIFDDGTSTLPIATVTGLTNGMEYHFRVSASNAAGTGDASQIVSEIPATTSERPNGIITNTISSTQIDISWNAPGNTGGSPLLGYRIDRSVESGPFDTIVSNSMSLATSYSDTNLLRGLDYSYRIYAISTAGTGDSSGVSRATTFDVAQPGTGLSIGATATS
ncbi:MAG: fibronectin type III domain-containing protein, partial [Robiginitomaculum sp.]|nr:fibronectin type III domain-containing protein [Robiginitomaculum sp.]